MKRRLTIMRGAGETAHPELYEVDLDASATLLDALEFLRTGAAPDLAYRHSCHHGSCGTCAVRVNGKEVLACLVTLESLVPGDAVPLVEPLKAFEPVADLAVDPGRLFRSLPKGISHTRASEWIDGAALPGTPVPAEGAGRIPAGIERYERFEDCIECGCCVSACPISQGPEPFMGPAALAALRRESINRPERRPVLLDMAEAPDGVAPCARHLDCSRVCPRGVYPGKQIEQLRREIAARPAKSQEYKKRKP